MSEETTLREAVAARLREHAERGVARVNVEVTGEQVTLWLREGQLRERCTCGAEACEHLRLAQALLGTSVSGLASAGSSDARPRSLRPVPSAGEPTQVADALDELSLAAARAGFAHPDSPSIQRAIAQLLETEPVPPAIARYVGRLSRALARADVGAVARLLDGALRLADELRQAEPRADAVARQRAWLGARAAGSPASVADLSLLEVAREWLTGLDRAAIERRYLLDLASGEVFVEERPRAAPDASVGPCPRLLHVAFAELEVAHRPAQLRLLQYTLSLQLTSEHWSRVMKFAQTEVAGVRARYLHDLAAAPALAEPLVIFTPAVLQDGNIVALRDAHGGLLPLADTEAENDGRTQVLRDLGESGSLACVLGRLVEGDHGLALCPLSAVVRRGASLTLQRLT